MDWYGTDDTDLTDVHGLKTDKICVIPFHQRHPCAIFKSHQIIQIGLILCFCCLQSLLAWIYP